MKTSDQVFAIFVSAVLAAPLIILFSYFATPIVGDLGWGWLYIYPFVWVANTIVLYLLVSTYLKKRYYKSENTSHYQQREISESVKPASSQTTLILSIITSFILSSILTLAIGSLINSILIRNESILDNPKFVYFDTFYLLLRGPLFLAIFIVSFIVVNKFLANRRSKK